MNDPTVRLLARACAQVGLHGVHVTHVASIPDSMHTIPGMYFVTFRYNPHRPTLLFRTLADLQRAIRELLSADPARYTANADDNTSATVVLQYGAPSGIDRMSIIVQVIAQTDAIDPVFSVQDQTNTHRDRAYRGGVPSGSRVTQRTARNVTDTTRRFTLTMANIEQAIIALQQYVKENPDVLLHYDENIGDTEWATIDGPTNELYFYTTGGHDGRYNGKYIVEFGPGGNVVNVAVCVDYEECAGCDAEALDDQREYEQTVMPTRQGA